ncbi:hypothetical protein C1886_19475 [Pseudomonas sp. FW300-N1A1]|uniref:lipopolysaccharide kinase InaA family protein n=1 Tax=Pseudomonas sp. FW300-N1A1 TaxID=2075555 RepID=UPI000CD014B2|nr:lipopolysaccharide kinase InaA family protein [Pseudomonas sp. FW300-N1A1]POA17949.1 hypothetical protein C1886_19475 [Pseudomonas sp. FW300-N1A1]
MALSKHQIDRKFPCTIKDLRSTIHLDHTPSTSLSQALFGLLNHRRQSNIKRLSAAVTSAGASVFAKTQALDNIKSRIRVTLGKPKRSGDFDWPVEEFLNTVEANDRGANVAPLIGYGYKKSRLGLVEEFFIITHMLEGHTDGLQWLERNPTQIERLIKKSFALLRSLNESHITHMDFWAANLMLCESGDLPAKGIDLENCFHRKPHYPSETLGFQFGFFYHREIYRFVTEAQYDEWVEEALGQYENVNLENFKRFYQASKHTKIGRKERRRIFLEGVLDLS